MTNKLCKTDSKRFVFDISNDISTYDLKHNNLKMTVYICSSPDKSSIQPYIDFMKEHAITDIFNFSNNEENSPYSADDLDEIMVHFIPISDGSYPTLEVLHRFDEIIDEIIKNGNAQIMLHCLAGLGRAPVMLAYLMISRFGYRSRDNRLCVIEEIREGRRSALNKQQIEWITSSKIQKHGSNSCIVC